MAEAATGAAPPAALASWIEGALGGAVAGWRRLVSGNSRTTWAADLVRGEETLPLVVRVDEGDGPFSGSALTLEREARAYAAVEGHGLPVPAFYAYDDGLRALVTERVAGAPAWDDEVLAAVLGAAARLHALEVGELELPGFARDARGELELWAGMAAERIAPRSELADFAFDFLRERFPGEPPRRVFVHGDLGVGNTMWDGRVTGLLDWEMAHVGDPLDDLAFLAVRTALHELDLEGFGTTVREHYDNAVILDPERFRYWQALGVLRNLVICRASISNPAPGKDRFVHFMLVPALERMLIGTLATMASIDLPPTPTPTLDPPPEPPTADLFHEFARELSDLPAEISDPERRQRVRRMRHLFSQLADTWPQATEIARLEQTEPPATTQADRILQLAARADRRLALFPRAAKMAGRRLAQLDDLAG